MNFLFLLLFWLIPFFFHFVPCNFFAQAVCKQTEITTGYGIKRRSVFQSAGVKFDLGCSGEVLSGARLQAKYNTQVLKIILYMLK